MKDMMKNLLYALKRYRIMPEMSYWEKTVPLDKSISSLYNISRRTIISQEHKIQQFPLLVHRVGGGH